MNSIALLEVRRGDVLAEALAPDGNGPCPGERLRVGGIDLGAGETLQFGNAETTAIGLEAGVVVDPAAGVQIDPEVRPGADLEARLQLDQQVAVGSSINAHATAARAAKNTVLKSPEALYL